MRIDDLNRTPGTQSTEQAGQAGQTRSVGKEFAGHKGTDSGAAAGADQAEVSPLAQSLAAQAPERIEQLRLSVQSGTYNVSSQALANALIDAHLKE